MPLLPVSRLLQRTPPAYLGIHDSIPGLLCVYVVGPTVIAENTVFVRAEQRECVLTGSGNGDCQRAQLRPTAGTSHGGLEREGMRTTIGNQGDDFLDVTGSKILDHRRSLFSDIPYGVVAVGGYL